MHHMQYCFALNESRDDIANPQNKKSDQITHRFQPSKGQNSVSYYFKWRS